MSINRWKVHCTTEGEDVYGFLHESDGTPTACFNNNSHTIDTIKTKRIELISDSYTGELAYWKIYCDTEEAYAYGYSDVFPYPERCFNNVDHVISKKPIKLRRIKNSRQYVDIEEEHPAGEQTSGRFRTEGFEITATNNTVTKKDFSWIYPVSALLIKFQSEETHRGDYISCFAYPTTYLGNLSSGVNSGVSTLPVVSTTPFSVGMSIVITDSYNTERLGKITSISTQNSTITVQTSTGFAYNKNAYLSYLNPVGVVTAGLTAGDYQITCSSSIMQNVKKGMVLNVYDATNNESLGEVLDIDEATSKLTVQKTTSNNYSAGSYVSVRLQMIKNYKLAGPSDHIIGSGKIGASYIPKFNLISIEYTNNSLLTSKSFSWSTEILY